MQQIEPLTSTLHYIRDLLSFGTDKPSISEFDTPDGKPYVNPPQVISAVKQIVATQGQVLVQRILTGMMFSFPGDCFPDASAVLMTLFDLIPQQAAAWVQATVQMLPTGTVKPGEANRLMKGITESVREGQLRKVRVLLQGLSILLIILGVHSFFEKLHSTDTYRFHQLVSPEKCRSKRRPWPIGGHSVQV